MSEIITRHEYAPLINKKILIGLTASSAIYRSIDLIRMLRRMGAEVRVVLTKDSLKLIGTDLVEWASGSKPYLELSGGVEHLTLARWCDSLVIAPATLNTLSKIAYSIVDELLPLLTTTVLGLGKKTIVVPTMNIALYKSPQYNRVMSILNDMGIVSIPPYIEEDRVKYPPLNDLVHCIDSIVNRGIDLRGKKILVTAGPTYEHIDPIRIITNPSSGLMGVLIAREAACRGAEVDLIHGPLKSTPPYMVNKYPVESTAEMAHTVSKLSEEKRYDAAVFAAAPSDFTVMSRSLRKISSHEKTRLNIILKPSIKTVKALSKKNKPSVTIIFSAETVDDHGTLIEKALEKLREYEADLAIANNIYRGVGFSENYMDSCIVREDEHICLGVVRKELVARKIIDYIRDNIV